MNVENEYVRKLEELISEKLLPVYDKYYELIEQPKPELDVLVISKLDRKIPALFKPKQGF